MEYSYTDPYLLELIKAAIEDEKKAAQLYKELSENSDLDRSQKEVFKKISNDELKHHTMLSEIYEKLNNPTVTDIKTENLAQEAHDSNHIADLINKKVENTELYRTFYFALPQHKFKNYIFEIMSDEQNHALLMCRL